MLLGNNINPKLNDVQGAIMAVGASKPTAVANADGFFSVKNKMLVCLAFCSHFYALLSARFDNYRSEIY